jgi:hypothetical protein
MRLRGGQGQLGPIERSLLATQSRKVIGSKERWDIKAVGLALVFSLSRTPMEVVVGGVLDLCDRYDLTCCLDLPSSRNREHCVIQDFSAIASAATGWVVRPTRRGLMGRCSGHQQQSQYCCRHSAHFILRAALLRAMSRQRLHRLSRRCVKISVRAAHAAGTKLSILAQGRALSSAGTFVEREVGRIAVFANAIPGRRVSWGPFSCACGRATSAERRRLQGLCPPVPTLATPQGVLQAALRP